MEPEAGILVTAQQAEDRENGRLIQRFGGFVSLSGALLLMTVRVKAKSEKERKRAKMVKLLMVGGGFGVFMLSQMETA